ncbi:hypothetical protein OHV05_35230 (plasmid) [Kitasatospora sp. NBC_00070]|uniref:hypothetical protein n=1 Tax=Kitasatospora sp. NBC_00070 TaxID=2975962 RepID=UPI002F91BC27
MGRPTRITALDELGPTWKLGGWADVPGLHLVLDRGVQVGWVEYGVGGVNRWLAIAQDSYLADGESDQPMWHTTERLAACTVRAAISQGMI